MKHPAKCMTHPVTSIVCGACPNTALQGTSRQLPMKTEAKRMMHPNSTAKDQYNVCITFF